MASLSPVGLAAMAIILLALIKSSSADNNESTSSSTEEETIVFQTPAPPVASRRCYVCGPRAAQPHRSRRPPTCQGFTEPGGLVEDCDRGHNYCALVITLNPYVESRLCVPQYNLDCTAKVCNTTNTTVVTCSCQGDLCNGNAEKMRKVNEAVAAAIASTASPRTERQVKIDPTPHNVNRMTISPDQVSEVKKESPPQTHTTMRSAANEDLATNLTSALPAPTPTEPSHTTIKNHTNDEHINHHEKDTTQLMSDDPHGNVRNIAIPGKTTTNHVPHGSALDYDEETEDDDEGSGRSADEQRNGKRPSGHGQAEADQRRATGATFTTTDTPNAANTMPPFSYIVLCFLAILSLY